VTSATQGGVALAALWRLLSLGFTSPTEETVAEVDVLADGLVEAGAPSEVAEVLEAIRASELEELGAQFSALFRGTVRVPPYEGSYEVDPLRQGRQMADAAAFYRAFGAEAHGPTIERPDFVGCELEFLSFLELRRLAGVEADEEGVDLVEEIGDTFLADHAGRWLPTFFADVERESATAPFYRALAVLGARVMSEQLELRGIEPSPLPRRRTRSSVERDSFECGAGTEASNNAPRGRGRRNL
jgi:TorA maturation chaperone TorD